MKRVAVLLLTALSLSALMMLAACGGDDGGGVELGTVSALYSASGADWNDYVKNDGADVFTATGAACVGTETGGYSACLHGGEMRTFEVTDRADCTGLTATDTLGAFDWTCTVFEGAAVMASTGLAEGKRLSDLLDFAAPAFKPNRVRVYDGGSVYGATASSVWWGNPVVVDNDGGSLGVAGTIYVVTANPNAAYILGAPSVGLVVAPGLTISDPVAGGAVISANTMNFLWFEGIVDATGDYKGVYWNSIRFSVLRNVEANNGDSGVYLWFSENNTLSNVSAANNAYGVYLFSSSNNTLTNVSAANNTSTGVCIDTSFNNTLSNVSAANNQFYGVLLVTSFNNTLSDVSAANNGAYGVYLSSSSNNYFTGLLKVGGNATDCYAYLGTNPGLVHITCTDSGVYGSSSYTGNSSDAVLHNGITMANSFVGKVLTDDTANASDADGAADYIAIADRTNFENMYRGWGKEGIAFPAASNRGQCIAGETCRIWDWSLLSTDTVIRDVYAGVLPTGGETITHMWYSETAPIDQAACTAAVPGSTFVTDRCENTFLRNAVEIQADGIGNDNTLCESDETCLYTPNIGAYQGHGALTSAGAIGAGGTLENITLMNYATNGY